MIGVLCSEEEKGVAREFFELFKTPWEFFNHKKRYDVVLTTQNLTFPVNSADCLVCYNLSCSDKRISEEKVPYFSCKNKYFLYDGSKVPVYGNFLPFSPDGVPVIRTGNSCQVVGDRISNKGKTVFRIGFNLFKEVAYLLSQGQPAINASIQTLDIHISVLRNMILSAGIPLVEIPPVPKNYNSFVCLTHDVDFVRIANHKCDHTLFGFLYKATIGSFLNFLRGKSSISNCLINLRAAFSLPFVYIGLKKDFWLQFENYLHIEKGLRSTYFFIPFKDRAGDKVSMHKPERRAARYDITDVQNWAKLLLEKGYEIGVHGIDSWHDSKKGRFELNEITKAIGVKQAGNRTHWLCCNSNSPKLLEDAGFSYDSTFGYNETVGFRAGTAQVFRPLTVKRILEVPLHIQDVALFNPSFLNTTDEQAEQSCNEIINQVLTYGGVLTILWHLRSAAPERLWGGFYTRLLDQLKKHRMWFATTSQVVEWFRLRRTISFTNDSFSDNQLNLCLESQVGTSYSKFALRVYRPFFNEAALSKKAADYIEIPWSGEKSVTIPFQ